MKIDLDMLAATYESQLETDFVPIPVGSICLDTVSKFDLYLKVRPEESPVLYIQKGTRFTEETLRSVKERHIQQLHVAAGHIEDYRVYIEENLPSVLKSPDATPAQKAQILYTCSNHVVKKIFERPDEDFSILRGKAVVDNTIEYMLTNHTALRYMLKAVSADYTAFTHSLNGMLFSLALAQRVGFDDAADLQHLGLGALLRDIGMSKIDNKIVAKPGRLSMGEFQLIMQHPAIGEKMVRDYGFVGDKEREIILQHHERVDGSGYNEGLRGDEISTMVRIVSIADVFNALTSDRPYRKRLSSFDALKYIMGHFKSKLDINLFGIFVDMLGKPD